MGFTIRMRTIFIALLFVQAGIVAAQPQDGLVAYYSFDACDATENTGSGADGIIMGNTVCGCGVQGDGFRFDGLTTIQILGNLDILFTADFTISFFMLPEPGGNAIMDIMSKSETCGGDSTLELRYNPVTREVGLTLSQQSNLTVRSTHTVPTDRCYHHIAFVRRQRELVVYYDGVPMQVSPSASVVRIQNDGILTLGGGPCLANGEVRFRGVMDELRLYNRALTTAEVQELYLPVDRITSPDTVLFTGTSMQSRLPITCAPNVQWNPTTGVTPANVAQPMIAPTVSTTYEVALDYGFCIALDQINITVADSAELECDKVFFPNAFTPNNDGINDVWGMSNVVFLGDFESLHVYDRWGGETFATTDPSARWDGTQNGKDIDPGIFTYVFVFRCDESVKKKVGSVVLMR